MEFEIWHYWAIATLLFFILEIFVPSFIMASIGIGCVFALAGAFFDIPLVYQLVFLIIGILVGFVGVRPFMQHYAWRTEKEVVTNYHALIGRVGKVCDAIDSENSGHIMLDGDTWQAVSFNDMPIERGTRVEVIAIDSIVVTVKPIISENTIETTDNEKNDTSAETEMHTTNTENTSEKLMVSVGLKQQILNPLDIVCAYSNNKITSLLLKNTSLITIDDSLDKLEQKLPPELFFRANRQCIISPDCVCEIKKSANGKLTVYLLENSLLPDNITVSRLKAGKFKLWLNQHCEKI